jgi:hypothetical protein
MADRIKNPAPGEVFAVLLPGQRRALLTAPRILSAGRP